MNPFWEWVVKQMPMWLAPNMLTLIGLFFNMGFYLTMLYYDFSLGKQSPVWTMVGFAIGLFFYQTLDAIDGKQARRTGSSSPLG